MGRPGVRTLGCLALPLLAVVVSIGSIAPSAPFDGWSPPQLTAPPRHQGQGAAGDAHSKRGGSGERAAPSMARSSAKLVRDVVRHVAVLADALAWLVAAAPPVVRPRRAGRRRWSEAPGPPDLWWSGAPTRPHRAPPLLPTA